MVEYIFVNTTLALLEARLTRNPLADAELQQVLTVCVEQVQGFTKAVQPVLDNKAFVYNLYSSLIGVLSRDYFNMATERVWDTVPALIASGRSKSQPIAYARIEALRYVHMHVLDQLGVDDTLAFLTKYCAVLKGSKLNKEARLTLSLTVVGMLEKIAAQPFNQEVDFLELHRLLAGLFDTFSATKRKQRDVHVQTWYPLLSALLASADQKFFVQHWIDLCTSMGRPLRDKSLRPFCLQSIKLLVATYCDKFSADEAGFVTSMDAICALVFPSKITKTTLTYQGESVSSLELFVDIAVAISRRELEYAMRKIVFEFIRADKLRGDSQPEKVYIAVRAIFGIHDAIREDEQRSMGANLLRISIDEGPDRTSEGDGGIGTMMKVYMPSICDFLSQILLSLDGMFGNWLIFNQSRSLDGREFPCRVHLFITSSQIF
jgi:hypothetical protein